jgi:serine/threonine protein phosphatase PrpC
VSAKLEITVGQFSDRGSKTENQDFYGVMQPRDRLRKTKGIAIAIADGISASERGREAAEACVAGFLADYFSTPESWTVQRSVQKIMTALNTWMYSQGRDHHDPRRGMVSTLSALVLKSTTAHLFHVGDTRVYRLRNGHFEQITEDHKTWISEEKSYLSRAMGADLRLEIDYRKLSLIERDVYFFTTDGVHEYLDGKEIVRLFEDHGQNLDKAAERIARAALAQQSPDNVTCQIVRIDHLPTQDADDVYQELTELPFPPALAPGMILDGYRIVRELHSSKRTQLYLAVDVDSGQQVALKTPSANYDDDPAYIERFILEEWIGRRIDNAHVVKVHPPSRQRRFLYHVSEYLDGVTLRQWLHEHPHRDLEQVRGILDQIVKGLRAFHRLEMLHQDLKPENIMIDRQGTVKLVDFGSAAIAGMNEITLPFERLQQLGTKNYCAPEYFRNDRGTMLSDLYSLGVIAYELLTGRLPYGELPEPWPSARAIAQLKYRRATDHDSRIPQWVDGALRKAVHLDPQQRYAALSEFLYDLRHPNQYLVQADHRALLERNPAAFWRGLAIVLLVINLMLCYWLINS